MDAVEVARQLFAAVAAGDIDTVRELYAPDCTVWLNARGRAQTVEENTRALAWMTRMLRDIRYEDVRCQPTPEGFVQQHVLRGTTASGAPFEVPACMVGRVEDGKITRLEEYLDSAHLQTLLS